MLPGNFSTACFLIRNRHDLSPVGRLKVNEKLGLNVPLTMRVLTDGDIVEIVRYLLNLRTGKGKSMISTTWATGGYAVLENSWKTISG